MTPEDRTAQHLGRPLTSDEVALVRRMSGRGATDEQILEVMALPAVEKEAQLAVGYVSVGREARRVTPIPPVES